jgi:hypothetical protein
LEVETDWNAGVPDIEKPGFAPTSAMDWLSTGSNSLKPLWKASSGAVSTGCGKLAFAGDTAPFLEQRLEQPAKSTDAA